MNLAALCLDQPDDQMAGTDMGDVRQDATYDLQSQSVEGLERSLLSGRLGQVDRMVVLLGQSPYCATANLAIWKIVAISAPLFGLSQSGALVSRLENAEKVSGVLTDADGAVLLEDLALARYVAEQTAGGSVPFADVTADTPTVLIYSSSTFCKPIGAFHGDGVLIVSSRAQKSDPNACARMITKPSVLYVFFLATALDFLKASDFSIADLRCVSSCGEPLGAEVLASWQAALAMTINEFYGRTECNMILSFCAVGFAPRACCIEKPAPGFDVQVIGADETGGGDFPIRRAASSMMLEYWPPSHAEKFRGDLMLTGDRGGQKGDFIRLVGRDDDIIKSTGCRIGSSEIEDFLLTYKDVANGGGMGKSDPLRTEIVKAFAVLQSSGTMPDAAAPQAHVKARLARYAYSRDAKFVDALPMTVTGKVICKNLKARAARGVA